MITLSETLPDAESPSRIKTHEMYKRLMTVAELLKKSVQQHTNNEEIRQLEGEKTQDSKTVVS